MKFFKTFLASLLAVIVGTGLLAMIQTLIFVGMIAAMGSFGSPAAVIHNESVLRLNLGTVTDSPQSSPFAGFDFMSMKPASHTSLLKTVEAIQAAAADDRIEGIYMNFDENVSVSLASLEELRAELVKFRESGKFIVAYQESWAQIGYWFASVADEIYTNPAGGMQWTGLSLEMMFYKGLLDKLDIEPIVVRHGSFKSAVEPFILDKMSPENRLQYEKLIGSLWGMVVDGVASSRGIAPADLQRFADELTIDSPAAALASGLVDGIVYEDQMMDIIASKVKGDTLTAEDSTAQTGTETEEPAGVEPGIADETSSEPKDEPKIVSFGDYASQLTPAGTSSRNKVAVVYAEGDIVSGEGGQGQIGSASMVETIKRVRDDKTVKAVVFRINSPGGSALASEVMWRELELLKAQKPVIVSMGNYAASGGYYIAAPADAIYADRTTLTGSIGVFGLFANVSSALKSNLGVTTDVVTTNRYSDIGSLYHTPSAAELAYFQKSVEETYGTFVGHVAEGRNMTPEAVDAIGQGRVWAGADALEIGLIDGIGGLADAIRLAADRVGIADDYRVWEALAVPTGIEALFAGFSGSVGSWIRGAVLRDELGDAFTEYESLRRMLDDNEVQARMPYILEIR